MEKCGRCFFDESCIYELEKSVTIQFIIEKRRKRIFREFAWFENNFDGFSFSTWSFSKQMYTDSIQFAAVWINVFRFEIVFEGFAHVSQNYDNFISNENFKELKKDFQKFRILILNLRDRWQFKRDFNDKNLAQTWSTLRINVERNIPRSIYRDNALALLTSSSIFVSFTPPATSLSRKR